MGKYDIDPGVVIFDIDGTVANLDHRKHYVDSKFVTIPFKFKKDWKTFYSKMANDSVIHQMIGICNSYHMNGWDVYFFTGRPEKYRSITKIWLKNKGFMYKELNMRQDADHYVNDAIVKKDMLDKLNRKVHIVFDDRDRVVKMWRDQGILCLQCNYGDF